MINVIFLSNNETVYYLIIVLNVFFKPKTIYQTFKVMRVFISYFKAHECNSLNDSNLCCLGLMHNKKFRNDFVCYHYHLGKFPLKLLSAKFSPLLCSLYINLLRCDLMGMKPHASMTKTIIISRSHTMYPQSSPLTLSEACFTIRLLQQKESDDLIIVILK